MNSAEKISPVIDRLETVLTRGNVPPPYDRWGARLLAHLTRPVQVVVTGLPGTGKTALLEMLSARPVLGDGAAAPVVELAYGDRNRALIERPDGSVSELAGLLKDTECPADAVRVRQELPDPRLAAQDFVEIGLTGSQAEKLAILEKVVERADIILWCSQDFSDEEQHLWAAVPDHMKDHSFLVLTMSDRLMMRGVLPQLITRLEPVVSEEFLGLCPVATIQGITAQTSDKTVDETLWASSGGKRLMGLVLDQVRQGRAADIDQGRIFLERLAEQAPEEPAAQAEPPAPRAPAPPAQVAITPAPPPADAAPAGPSTTGPQTDALLSEAVELLQKQAGQLLDTVDTSTGLDADAILRGCVDAVSSLSGLLDGADSKDPQAQAVRDDLQDGEEMLMLFQLERGEDAALDAVTLLLQLRKELIDKVTG